MNRLKKVLSPSILGPEIKEGRALVPAVFDPCFKKIFLECRPFLIEYLHQLLGFTRIYLEEHLEIRNTEHPKDRINEKKGQSDIIVEVLNTAIILEMNTSYNAGSVEKSISYFSRKLLSGIKTGSKYKGNRVNILIDFALEEPSYFKKTKDSILRFGILEEKYHFPLTKNVKFLVINLAKIYEKWYNKEKLDEFEKRLLFLVLTNKEELSKLCKGDKIMEEAKETLEGLNSEELFLAYEAEAIERYGRQVDLYNAEEKGIKKGLKKGIKQGMMENKLENAKSLLRQGKLSIEDIAEAINLPLKEVEKLKKEL